MNDLINSQRRQLEKRDHKKKKAFEDMLVALELKEKKRREEAEISRQEEERYMAYIKELDSR